MLAQLAKIKSLTFFTSESALHTKVYESDKFDGTDPHKPQIFLVVWAELPRLPKGMALEWFELNLLQMENLVLKSNWMNDFKEFVLELQTNIGPHNPIGDMEHPLDHLSMKDGQCINKYAVELTR